MGKIDITRVWRIIYLLFLVIGIVAGIVILQDNLRLSEQLQGRDKLIMERNRVDSIMCINSEENSKVYQKIESIGSGIVVAGAELTAGQLVSLINKLSNTNKSNELKNLILSDSINLLKRELNMVENAYGIKFQVENKSDSVLINMISSKDSLYFYKNLIEIINNEYGLKYSYKIVDNKYHFIKITTKVDTALWVFPYIKQQLKIDDKGKLNLVLPNKVIVFEKRL